MLRVAFAVLATQCFYSSFAIAAQTSDNAGNTNSQTASTNNIGPKEHANVPSEVNELYKTIINRELGTYAVVNTNRDIVSLKDNAGHIIWSTNIIEGLKTVPGRFQFDPDRSQVKIYRLDLFRGDLTASFNARGLVLIDKQTGSIKGFASN